MLPFLNFAARLAASFTFDAAISFSPLQDPVFRMRSLSVAKLFAVTYQQALIAKQWQASLPKIGFLLNHPEVPAEKGAHFLVADCAADCNSPPF